MLLLKRLPKAKFWKWSSYISECFRGFPVFRTNSEVQLFHSFPKRLLSSQTTRQERPQPASRLSTRESKSRPRKTVCQLVLDHFDSQYREELGKQWDSARNVLLNPHCWQYGVLLNRFSDLTGVQTHLKSLGYYSLLPQPLSASIHGPLECFVHKDAARLPSQRHHPGWLKQYYLLNAASLLPVLALGVKDGEKVLDLCSAPGGKALALLQTANPGLLHCNEVDESRYEWLLKTLESYIPPSVRETVTVTNVDGRTIGGSQPDMYDKVLVDAPCSNDRSWLFTPGAQQGELWLRERAQLPVLQKELLCTVPRKSEVCGLFLVVDAVKSTVARATCRSHDDVLGLLETPLCAC
ncbi:tRNA (cytosine(34)-C(5))-methyltransferase, mitochondrial isoform X2 [Salminus brasiliensis]|uniref:tRNA (cytosine(34)-C(5))-methyltransferase, mitochondrial isoform X2 n=1 Tax=Salminus brasiliensis TaxID=930266 RepID=UPI003B8358A5